MVKQREFALSPQVMIILPHQYGSKLYSKLIEVDHEYTVPLKPLDIVKKSCRYYASSYSGRKEGTKALIGVTHKAPIVIDPYQGIYLFPTASPGRADCIWISHSHVEDFQKAEHSKTEVLFSNGQSLVISVSAHTFQQQMYRTLNLRAKIEQRLAEYDMQTYPFFHPNFSMERSNVYQIYPKDSSLTPLSKNRLYKK